MGDSAAARLRSERTVCPFCSSGCGLYLRGSAAGIEGVGPSEHHPVSQGRLCARGWSAHEAAQWGPRLRTPLLRQEGELQPVSWERALAAAVDGLNALRQTGRPLGVLTSGRATNEESFLAVALARAALRTPHLDSGLRLQWEALLRGLGLVGHRPALGHALSGLENSDLVVLLEDDLAVTHPRVALAVLRAVRRGARLVTLGWQRTTLARLATSHIPLDPVDPLATLAALRTVHRLEGLLEGTQRASFLLSAFVADAGVLERASLILGELSASVAAAGREALFIPLPIRCNTRGALDMGVAPDLLSGRRPLDDAFARSVLHHVWGSDGCWEQGMDAAHMAGAVAGLVVVGEDLPAVHPFPARAREELAALEHLVVVDSFLTETAQAAHVVLPMAAFGEGEGTITGLEDHAQLLRPFNAPPAGVRHGWQILSELLEALGCPFHPTTLGQIHAVIAGAIPGYQRMTVPPSEIGWPVAWARIEALPPGAAGTARPGGPASSVAPEASPGHRLQLRRSGTFDWAQDPMVRYSPLLRRDAASLARRFPRGLVAMSPADAGALGVRDGWTVRLRSSAGEARVGLTVRDGIEAGMLLVPYAFREQLAAVLGADGVAEVEVQPA